MKKLIWVLLLLQSIIHAFCSYNKEEISAILNETYGYDFFECPEKGDLLVWKITHGLQKFVPLMTQEIPIIRLESDGTFLFMAHKKTKKINFYFWSGIDASLDNKKALAKYAIQLYTLTEKYYEYSNPENYISRETEGIESKSFMNTLNGWLNRKPVSLPSLDDMVTYQQYQNYFYSMYEETQFPSKLPHLYVVRGEDRTCMKKVSLNAEWNNVDDACLILETGNLNSLMRPLNVYCGKNSSGQSRQRSETYLTYFEYPYGVSLTRNIVEYSRVITDDLVDAPYLKQFREYLKHGDLYNTYMRNSFEDYNMTAEQFVANCDASLKAFRYTNFKDEFNVEEITERPLKTTNFTYSFAGYLLDTAGINGVHVILGNSSRNETRMKTMEEVEQYLHNKVKSPKPTHVRIIDDISNEKNTDLHINLVDWPLGDK